MKPIIGLIPLWDDEKESIWMLPGYLEGIEMAGGIPLIFPLTTDKENIKELVNQVDGILLTGGHDVSPYLYKEEKLDNVECCEKRDYMEYMVLKYSLQQHKSILGICRGIQLLNVYFKGSLYQDLPTQYKSEVNHHQSPPYDIPAHSVNIVKDSPLYDVLKIDSLRVNSYHHQAIKSLAQDLSIMAISEDGLIEGVYKEDERFVWGIQWHPEFNYKIDFNSQKIFLAFIDSMRL